MTDKMRSVTAVLILLLSSAVAKPCSTSCVTIPVCDLVSSAEAIVAAEVENVSEDVDEHMVRVQMRVVDRYKDSPLVGETLLKVVADRDSKVGTRWLVAFLKDPQSGAIEQAGGCTDRTVESDSPEVRFLQAWTAGALDELTQLLVRTELPGITVVAEGLGRRFEGVSSKSGVVAFEGLPRGVYVVRASAPGFEVLEPDYYEKVDLLERPCGYANLRLFATNRLTGTVYGPEGEPVPDVAVSLIRADEQGGPGHTVYQTTDSAGRFVFRAADPGRYWLAASTGLFKEPNPFPATFLPGTESLKAATAIELGAGDTLGEMDIHIGRRLKERSVRVQVLWSDGSPAAGARIVGASDGRINQSTGYYSSSGNYRSSLTDEEGWANVTVYESLRYRLKASFFTWEHRIGRGQGEPGESLPFAINPGTGPVDVEARLRRFRMVDCGGREFID